jgi:hypothetical protein
LAEICHGCIGIEDVRRKEQRGSGASRGQPPYIVLIVDDDEIIRRGIAAIVAAEPDLCVCGLVSDEVTAVRLMDVMNLIFSCSTFRLVIATACNS